MAASGRSSPSGNRISARLAAGLPREDAVEAVLAVYRALLTASDSEEHVKQLLAERKGSLAVQEHIRALTEANRRAQ